MTFLRWLAMGIALPWASRISVVWGPGSPTALWVIGTTVTSAPESRITCSNSTGCTRTARTWSSGSGSSSSLSAMLKTNVLVDLNSASTSTAFPGLNETIRTSRSKASSSNHSSSSPRSKNSHVGTAGGSKITRLMSSGCSGTTSRRRTFGAALGARPVVVEGEVEELAVDAAEEGTVVEASSLTCCTRPPTLQSAAT